MARDGVGIQMCYRRVCGSTPGDWDSDNPVFAISLRRCRTTAYTSSAVSRFTNMLLSPRPFGSRSVVRLGVIYPELRPPLVAIPSVRDTAHAFTAHGFRLKGSSFFPLPPPPWSTPWTACAFGRGQWYLIPLSLWPFPMCQVFPGSECRVGGGGACGPASVRSFKRLVQFSRKPLSSAAHLWGIAHGQCVWVLLRTRSPRDQGWVFHTGNCPTTCSILTDSWHPLFTAEHRAFPLQRPFWVTLVSQLTAVLRRFLLFLRS